MPKSVFVCVCIYIYIYVCVCVCVYVRMYKRAFGMHAFLKVKRYFKHFIYLFIYLELQIYTLLPVQQ